jgi:hypothetical protein
MKVLEFCAFLIGMVIVVPYLLLLLIHWLNTDADFWPFRED